MKFYVYELRDGGGTVFYVGKGSGSRLTVHTSKARAGDKSHRACKIRQLWQRGDTVSAVIVFTTDDEAAAFAEEKRLIALYGRDALTNKTDGGDGPCNPSQDVRDKIAAGRRGLVASQETRQKQREAKLGTTRPEAVKAKIAATQRGMKKPWAAYPRSEEYKRNMSRRTSGRTFSPEHCRAISMGKMGHVQTEETKQKISKSKKGSTPWNKGMKVKTSLQINT